MMDTPHKNSSFSYKVIHPTIRKILDSRSRLNNKVQMAMPFVKATTTLNMNGIYGDGNIGFTLGLHAIQEDITAQNIYANADGNALVGYTYNGDGQTEKVYAQVNEELESSQLKFFNKGASLYSSEPDKKFSHIPPPGIISATIGTIKNGVVSSAQLEIVVPTLPQLELLHKTFLVPGVGMVVEWGQQFSQQTPGRAEDFGEEAGVIENHMFPWHNRPALTDILERLARNEIGTEEIVNCYVHPTQGQYQWIFGRVANFNVKSNGDGSFNCSVKIVGPAENAWAYSTRNTVIPATATRRGAICINGVNSVEDYFTKTTSPAVPPNFKSLLEGVKNKSILPDWNSHVQYFEQGNKKGGGDDSVDANVDQSSFGDSEEAYFITWRFFVNVVLNHKEYGLQSIFRNAGVLDSELDKTRLIRPYGDTASLDTPGPQYIDDPYETFVGNNQYLRSTDPSTLIIVNETAADILTSFLGNKRSDLLSSGRGGVQGYFGIGPGVTEANVESGKFLDVGDFQRSDFATPDKKLGHNDRGFLSAGVWLNHKAVIQAMLGADTIATGLSNLLNRMNAATLNYWKLTLDVSEPLAAKVCIPGDTASPPSAFSYTVADMNYKENAQSAVTNFINDVHTFNKYIREDNGTLVGSDVLDCSVDINLPKRLFSQIATMGLVQQDDVTQSTGGAPKVGDANDTLRKMFAITQVGRDANGQSPDLTAPILNRSGTAGSACGGTVNPLPAGAAGQGASATPTPAAAATPPSDAALQRDINLANLILKSAPCTTVCAAEVAAASTSQPPVGPSTASARRAPKRPGVPVLSELTVGQILNIQKPRGQVFAVGKYQAIPGTFKGWIDAKNIDLNTIFNEATQERLGDWLFGEKRAAVRDFVNGSTEVTLNDAQLALAKEFASVPVPFTVIRPSGAAGRSDLGGIVQAGQSYYYGVGGNTAAPSAAKYRIALQEARNTKNFNPIKQVVASGEGNIDDINTGEAGDTRLYSNEYYEALSSATTAPDTPTPSPATVTTSTTTAAPLPAAAARLTPEQLVAARAASNAAAGVSGRIGNASGDNPSVLATQDAIRLVRGTTDVTNPITCTDCIKAKRTSQQNSAQLAANKELDAGAAAIPRRFPGLEKLFRYIEPFGTLMLANITNSADGDISNAFGTAPGSLSINVDLTLPGISGLRVGQLFWLDRIPAFYKAFGAFQIINIENNIGVDGWTTKVSAKFNYMGTAWKNEIAKKLSLQ